MENNKQSKTYKLVTLFVAAALVAAPGCTNRSATSNCIDANQDGYCDNGSGSSSRSSYYTGGGSSGSVGSNNGSAGDSSPGISKGSSSHGGVGSSSSSSSS